MNFTAENNLVIIPARSGSKRYPGKNIKKLGAHPLFAWSILAAKKVSRFGRIYVSTDSEEYAEIAKSYGAEVPFMRSEEASTDAASTQDVLLEALKRYKEELKFEPKWIVILQPTSPYRSVGTINRGIDLFEKYQGETVVAVARQKVPKSWMVNLSSDAVIEKESDAQEKLPGYYICGTFYALSTEQLLKNKQIYSKPSRGLIIEDLVETFDIDTHEEWAMAERLIPLDGER